ncbi:Transposon Tn21 resolvase [Yersinia mollaretii ATCC 43969]|uniref:Transposon Tn21 resolvase n=1 Tax=Yersinia mollaretii (strain ATCC 43969 / DSM 18520 / CIP 103324 / CNY 7263 / WAIP 204) TaxID=349967 RepID=A0ABP2EHR7_YERMW|nr:Transposon Tn21 resolvase [Yersinia mollaretii ATCC 43969]
MKGQRIGYIRVSSFDQNPERQRDQTQVIKSSPIKHLAKMPCGQNWIPYKPVVFLLQYRHENRPH